MLYAKDQEVMSNLLPLPRIERITNALTQQIIPEHGHENGESGEGRKPPGDLDVVLA